MNTGNGPIRRSEALAPLSREHHEGLLLVWKIRQGLKNGTPLADIVAYVNWFWQHHLQPHFRQEEDLLVPMAPDNEHIRQMLREHLQLRNTMESGNFTEGSLLETAQLLNDHIRFEERVLFPEIEKMATAEQLAAISEDLHQEPATKETWHDEFWLKK